MPKEFLEVGQIEPASVAPHAAEPIVRKPAFCELMREDLAEWCQENGAKPFRADQIRRWIFGKRVQDFESMHDVPAALRDALTTQFDLFSSEIVQHQVSKDGTEKLLLAMADGSRVECVLMRELNRRTICISTQVGCGMGCVFCASGLLGLKRNLTRGEILEQVFRLDRVLGPDERITNVVVMGIGEPLSNLSALLPVLVTLNEKGGMGIGARRITISTVGLPEKIRELSQFGTPFNLAISLHAPNDELRSRIVPVNEKIGIDGIMDAADEYFDRTGRRVTYEYVLLEGVNDLPEHAQQLVDLLRYRKAHVNLIPMNDVSGLPFRGPSADRTQRFVDVLDAGKLVVTLRKRKGADIDAACGQLRLNHSEAADVR